jgi:hypothetical protein
MTYFENFNLAPYAVTPAQGPDGKLFMFFGTIPQELTFYGPAPVATFTPATVRISIPDEEEASITLTPKGISNNVMASPTTSPKRRRQPSKKTAPTVAAQVTHNSQVSRKRALDASPCPSSASHRQLPVEAVRSARKRVAQHAWLFISYLLVYIVEGYIL